MLYRQINIGTVLFDQTWNRIAPPIWLWEGEVTTVDGSRQTGDDGLDIRTVSLGVSSTFTGRRRPPLMTFTDAHQRRISARLDVEPHERVRSTTNLK